MVEQTKQYIKNLLKKDLGSPIPNFIFLKTVVTPQIMLKTS